jgi:hypothetical protein
MGLHEKSLAYSKNDYAGPEDITTFLENLIPNNLNPSEDVKKMPGYDVQLYRQMRVNELESYSRDILNLKQNVENLEETKRMEILDFLYRASESTLTDAEINRIYREEEEEEEEQEDFPGYPDLHSEVETIASGLLSGYIRISQDGGVGQSGSRYIRIPLHFLLLLISFSRIIFYIVSTKDVALSQKQNNAYMRKLVLLDMFFTLGFIHLCLVLELVSEGDVSRSFLLLFLTPFFVFLAGEISVSKRNTLLVVVAGCLSSSAIMRIT